MPEPQTFAVADAADVRALRVAAEDVDPRLVGLVPTGVGVDSFDAVPKSAVPLACSRLRACSRSWPPMPLTSTLDQQR